MSNATDRVVQVFAPIGTDGLGRTGTGYLTGDGLILTARHVIEGATGQCEARPLAGGGWVPADVVWMGRAEVDGALLHVDGEVGDLPRVRFGRLASDVRAPCQTTGFPWAQMLERRDADHGPVRAVEHIEGHLDRVSGRAAGVAAWLMALHVTGSVPKARDQGASAWAGMSGAGVVCGALLVAVVTRDPARFGPDRLLSVAVEELFRDPGFIGALEAACSEPPLLEAVEAQDVLERPYVPPPAALARQSSSFLLGARYGVVAFRERSELKRLHKWVDSGENVDVAVLSGQGGVGKTRLACELCTQLGRDGWVTGMLAFDADRRQVARLVCVDAPLLVVVDYAEARADDVVRLLEALGPSAPRRRLLLIARQLGDWWSQLPSASKDEHVRGLLGCALPVAVGVAHERTEDRVAAHQEAIEAFARYTGPPHHRSPAPDLSDRLFETVLFVHMAALGTLPGGGDPPPGVTGAIRADLMARTLAREERYWRDSARALVPPLEIDARVRRRAVAIATLATPTTTGSPAGELEAAALLEVLPDLDTLAVRCRVGHWLHGLYPARSGWIAPLEPDLLGEALVGQVGADAPGLVEALLERSDIATAARALTVLTRGARHNDICRVTLGDALQRHLTDLGPLAVGIAQQLGDPIGTLLAGALENDPDPSLSRGLLAMMPRETVSLREAALTASTQALAGVGDNATDRAGLLVDHSVRLGQVARHDDALAAIKDAVRDYRGLAATAPDDGFLFDLASSLVHESTVLGELGRTEDALAAGDEAIEIYGDLAAARPNAIIPDFAASLSNQAARLSALGRRDEALDAVNQAVNVYRHLVAMGRADYLPSLAGALNNQAAPLSHVGRRDEARAATDESVRLYRELAAARPDAFLPNLGASLSNHSGHLRELEHLDDALAAAEEAVGIFSVLAAGRPTAFLADLAASLSDQSNCLRRLRRREQALAAIDKAVAVYRELAMERQDAFLPALAASLDYQSGCLRALGHLEDALAAVNEAVGIFRALATARPEAFMPSLAMTLDNQSARLRELGRAEDALAAVNQAVGIFRALAAAHPDAFSDDLAMALDNQRGVLIALGRPADALASVSEAVAIYRELATAYPDPFGPGLASFLSHSSRLMSGLGRYSDALSAADEAIVVFRRLAVARPDAFMADLATSLQDRATLLNLLGRQTDALAAIDEAITIYRKQAAARPDAHLPNLAALLNNQAIFLSEQGRPEAALAASDEAIQIFRDLATARSDEFSVNLAMALGGRSTMLGDLERGEDALEAIDEALRVALPVLENAWHVLPDGGLRLAQRYIALCQESQLEPDTELMARMYAVLREAGVVPGED